MKTLLNYLLIMLCCSFVACSKDNTGNPTPTADYQIAERIYVGIDSVRDLEFDGTDFYLLTKSMLYKVNNKGAILSSKASGGIEGLAYDRSSGNLYTITGNINIKIDGSDDYIFKGDTAKTVKVFYKDSLVDANINGDPNSKALLISRFLDHDGTDFYTLLLHYPYSSKLKIWDTIPRSRLVKINSKGEIISIDQYSVGIPQGIAYKDNNVLYQYNYNRDIENPKNVNILKIIMDTNKIRCTNIKFIQELSLSDAMGLAIDEYGCLYTYSINTKEIVKLWRSP